MKSLTRSTPLRVVATLSVLALLVAGCGGGGSGGPTGPQGATVADVEVQSFGLMNEARAGSGVAALSLDARVAQVARRHSEAMRDEGFFGHKGADGAGLRARLRAAGIPFGAAGENLAQVSGVGDPAGVAHRQLMDSPSHRDNILSTGFSRAGVGVAQSGSTYWVTQIFIDP